MSRLNLTKTILRHGVWYGVVTGSGDTAPALRVTCQGTPLSDVSISRGPEGQNWSVRIPIPAEAIADGVQTILIADANNGAVLGHISLIAGEALGDDLRAEVGLLRAELDMLKKAFRRHCVETT